MQSNNFTTKEKDSWGFRLILDTISKCWPTTALYIKSHPSPQILNAISMVCWLLCVWKIIATFIIIIIIINDFQSQFNSLVWEQEKQDEEEVEEIIIIIIGAIEHNTVKSKWNKNCTLVAGRNSNNRTWFMSKARVVIIKLENIKCAIGFHNLINTYGCGNTKTFILFYWIIIII